MKKICLKDADVKVIAREMLVKPDGIICPYCYLDGGVVVKVSFGEDQTVQECLAHCILNNSEEIRTSLKR